MDADTSIIEALADPDLFAPHFKLHRKHGDTWQRWRVFLKALFALPMDAADLVIYQECTGRTDPPTEPVTEAALVVGRRGGKSRALALVAVFLTTFRDYDEYLAPGEVATVAVIAAGRKQARAIFRFALGLLKGVDLLAPMVKDSDTETITLTNRTAIEITTASFRTVRGGTLIAALCDEVAFYRSDENSANPDTEILRALRPALGTIPGSIMLLASSPYAKKGELYAAYRRHYGKAGAPVLVWQASTSTMNPAFPKATIDAEYEKDPESAAAEYGAQFRSDLADFITREVVDAITCVGRSDLPPEPGQTYHGFTDPSGGANDSMTLAIAHLEGDIGVLDAVLEIRPPFNPDDAVAECTALLRRFGIARVIGDRYAGLWPVARFAAHGITFEQSARAKSDIYVDFLPLANARRVELLDHPRLAAQLTGLERRTARGGRDSVDHTKGAHDDVANAVCGVLVGLDLDRRPALVRSNDMLADGQAVPLPWVCDVMLAVLAADQHGQCAVTYWAYSPNVGHPLTLADFDAAPLSPSLFVGIAERLKELSAQCRVRMGMRLLSTSEPLARQAAARGLAAEIVPPALIADPARLAMAAAGHVMDGDVKICTLAYDRAESSPLHGQLDLRGGDATDANPLRLALLAGIAVCLDDRLQSRAAAA